ncbi:alpha/beta fold family hydrolase [Gloeothece citriformis PCC 7424]|uniref:Alpha/beta fold family hydrolase n=1 Tax=Gloeothece citriformis (strain PCC 7424) TaxID=65393 RepID=B7K980_GLOC7|nr:alpha/beta hydrolase [Gloeothece citriformis]ACK68563.1 alpha/beta fold family hydrolase [Gloeothece citriformis PCC 7424]
MPRLSFIIPTTPKPDYPLFVFLPGMDGTGLLYQRQAEALCQWFDVRCLCIPADDQSSWDSLAYQVITLIEKELRIRQKYTTKGQLNSNNSPVADSVPDVSPSVYICGESFGGCLAIQVMLRAPWLFRGMILVNSASCFNQQPLLGWGISITRWLPDFLHHTSMIGLLPFLASLGRIELDERRALIKAMKAVPRNTAVWRLSLLRDFSVHEKNLQNLTQPALIIAGGSDRLLPSVEEAQKLKTHLPNAQMLVLPYSGHACLLEKEVRLDQILKDYYLPIKSVVMDNG